MSIALEPRNMLSAVGLVAHEIDSSSGDVTSLHVADIDGDELSDVVIVAHDQSTKMSDVAWYVRSNSHARQVVGSVESETALRIIPHDVDEDGDVDILFFAVGNPGEIGWYENTDGQGSFGAQHAIDSVLTELGQSPSLELADLNGDGHVDLLARVSDIASDTISQVFWYRNEGDEGSFSQLIPIADGPRLGQIVQSFDADTDGDEDVLISFLDAPAAGGVLWYENIDGDGQFASGEILVSSNSPPLFLQDIAVEDLDGDGRRDLVAASVFPESSIHWYRLAETTPAELMPIDESIQLPRSVDVVDLDGDGNQDLVVVGDDMDVFFLLNTASGGEFAAPVVIASGDLVQLTDFDGDGDVDVLTSGNAITLHENRLAGDVDDDGEVSFADFLQLAENFGKSDAVWDDGDLDGDGEVTFSDFLLLTVQFGRKR